MRWPWLWGRRLRGRGLTVRPASVCSFLDYLKADLLGRLLGVDCAEMQPVAASRRVVGFAGRTGHGFSGCRPFTT